MIFTSIHAFRNMRVRFEVKKQDLWIGAYWKTTTHTYYFHNFTDLWICLLPCLPIHISWLRRKK